MDKPQALENNIVSRWWEAEARLELISSMEIKDIEIIYTCIPFQDSELPRRVLAAHDTTALEMILAALGDIRRFGNICEQGKIRHPDMQIYQSRLAGKVVSFLNKRRTQSSPESAFSWEWEVPNVKTSAKSISSRVSLVFFTIAFSDWIRIALGYEMKSFSKLRDWMHSTQHACRECLVKTPHLRAHYERLEKELRPLHPWAHWLLATSLGSFDATSTVAKCSTTPRDYSADLLYILPYLLHPIRELFAEKEQGLVKLLQNIAVLKARYQHDIVQESDWTKPLSANFSLRNGLSEKNLAEFAASITEKDKSFFSFLHGTDFQSDSSGRLGQLDERLLEFSNDIRACVMADPDLVEPISELTMHLLSLRNFASATASLAALKSVRIRPKQLFKFWELVDSIGNHWSYRREYLKGPALPCPTPHIRELRITRNPQPVLAEIERFRSYHTVQDGRPMLGVGITADQVVLKFQTLDKLCLVCRLRKSEHDGLRLKCAECYRSEQISRRRKFAHLNVRKHDETAPQADDRSAKRIRVRPTSPKDLVMENPDCCPRPTIPQLGDEAVAKPSTPPTPPGTPPQQTALSLPDMSEFVAGLRRMRASRSHEQSRLQLQPSLYNSSKDSDRRALEPTDRNEASSCTISPGESVKMNSVNSMSSFPPSTMQPATLTFDSSFGKKTPEAAQKDRPRAYVSHRGEVIEASTSSAGGHVAADSSGEMQTLLPGSKVVNRKNCLPPPSAKRRQPLALEEAPNVANPRKEPVWWRMFESSLPQSTTSIVPDPLQCRTQETGLDSSVKQDRRVGYSKCPLPDVTTATGFTPVNQIHSSSPVPAIKHFNRNKSESSTIARYAPVGRYPGRYLPDPTQEGCQHGFSTVGFPPDITKMPNPLSGPPHGAWLQQNSPTHSDAYVRQPNPSTDGTCRPQAAEALPSSSNLNKGEAKAVKSQSELPRARSASPISGSFEESIRSTAKTTMELVNIHNIS